MKRYDARLKLEKLLSLAARPGTPAEGDAALAAAYRLADRYGFSIRRKTRRKAPTFVTEVPAGRCAWCGRRFLRARTGRPRVFCGVTCRVAHHRAYRAS